MNPALFVAKCRKLGVRGVISRVRGMAHRSHSDSFDLTHGTDTEGLIPLWTQAIDSPNAVNGSQYRSIDEYKLRALLEPLPRAATFVDLGCGKGKTLIIAARMGFARVIGVEFSPKWAEIARRNCSRAGVNAWVITGDAAEYRFPGGNVILYLYDPFDVTVMAAVVDHLRSHGGHAWVVYVNPRCRELFSWATKIDMTPAQQGLFSQSSVAIYRV